MPDATEKLLQEILEVNKAISERLDGIEKAVHDAAGYTSEAANYSSLVLSSLKDIETLIRDHVERD